MSEITVIDKPISDSVIKMLEEFLSYAKNGEINAAAIVAVGTDATTINCFAGDDISSSMLGELRVLERDIVDVCIETRRKPMWEYCE